MVNLKQQVDLVDYFGAPICFVTFFSIVFITCVTCIYWFCLEKTEDLGAFAKIGGRGRRGKYSVGSQRGSIKRESNA